MKFYLDHLPQDDTRSFNIFEAGYYHALNDFHYHTELEIVYIEAGQATLLIGDHFEQLQSGDMVMIGCNVPHMFKFERFAYHNDLMKQGEIPIETKLLTLHLNPDVFGESFMRLPENKLLNTLLKDALNGLIIKGECRDQVTALMNRLLTAPNYEHILLIIQLLNVVALSNEKQSITKPPGENAYNKLDETRLTRIYLYTLNNFSRVIKLQEVADIVHMVPNAFCRYFKLRTNKSYFDFLLDVRVRHACKLLKEKDYSIVVVCYESGFSNLSNFNRHFKSITGKTPLEYRKHFQA
ncbi:MAG: AraC family transcriptional regulator [Mucilaginibacter sp.]